MAAVLAVVLVLVLAGPAFPDDRARPPETFAPVAEAVKAAVFSVVRPGEEEHADDRARGDAWPENDLLHEIFDALTTPPSRTLGAALMIDPAGVAVTSARILRGLTAVELVALSGRRYRASLVARDDRTDVAVLRVVAPGPLPAARLGDSDAVRVGDWVLAVGSPYGFEASVSAGIVSARARVAAEGAYGDLLQTDAALNVGSAGGPLVDVHGEVIGVTTMAAPRGSSIAFAVPSNLVRRVVGDLLAHGRVVRSWLGIAPQPLTRELAHAFRAPFAGGLLLADVVAGGPAATAGLRRGAILLALDGRPLRALADLERVLGAVPPGRTATLHVWRDGREETLGIRLAQEPDPRQSDGPKRRLLGLVVEPITPEGGVFVREVLPGSPAADSGVIPGDVVRELAHQTIRTLGDFERAAESVTPREPTTLLVQRGRTPFYVGLTPER